jgi:hypothetical protein
MVVIQAVLRLKDFGVNSRQQRIHNSPDAERTISALNTQFTDALIAFHSTTDDRVHNAVVCAATFSTGRFHPSATWRSFVKCQALRG